MHTRFIFQRYIPSHWRQLIGYRGGAEDAFLAGVSRAHQQAGLDLHPTDATKTIPRGFSEFSEHEHGESLRLKNIMVRRDLKPQDWWRTGFEEDMARFALASKPILEFLDRN